MYNSLMQKNLKKPDFWLWLIGAVIVLIIIIFVTVGHTDSTPINSPTNTPDITTTNEPKQPDTVQPSTADDVTESPANSSSVVPSPSASIEPSTPSRAPSTVSTPDPNHCYHEEAGRCWDDIEDEVYSAGLYDHEYGYYGASLDFDADCDALCRDIMEDAYDEGWYDYH